MLRLVTQHLTAPNLKKLGHSQIFNRYGRSIIYRRALDINSRLDRIPGREALFLGVTTIPVRDLHSNINARVAVAPATPITDGTVLTTTILNTLGFESVELVISTGVLADADATFAVVLNESNDPAMAGANAVAATDMLGTLALASFTFAADNTCLKLGYVGNKQYIQATITPTNNTGSAPISAVWVLGHPAIVPTANPPV